MKVYFHFHDGVDRTLDLEGAELTLEQSRARALAEARALIADDALSGRIDLRQRIDIEDAEGIVLDTISFEDAVEIVGLPVPRPPFENGADITGSGDFPRPRHSRLP